MHRYLGVYRVPILTLFVAVIIYGVALPMVASDPSDRGKQVAASIVIWTFSLLFSLIIYRWVYYVLSERNDYSSPAGGVPLVNRTSLWAFLDVFLATYHLLAALGFSIWLMDTSVGKDAYFIGITELNATYSVFIGDFLLIAIVLFNAAGFSSLRPRSSTPLSAIWAMVVSLCGVLFISLLLSFLGRPRDKVTPFEPVSTFVSKFNVPRYSQYGIRPRVYKKQK